MEVHQMRAALLTRTKYKNSWKWIQRVKAMPDRQIIAVFYKMLRGGELK